MKSGAGAEHPEPKRPSVDGLLGKFAAPAEPSGSPGRDAPPPAAPPKPGKLPLPGALQPGGAAARPPLPGGRAQGAAGAEFPSPPSDPDFPPPPPDLELPPPPAETPAACSGIASPRVAVVNPQPQPWAKAAARRAPPPTRPRRSDSTRLTPADAPEQPASASATATAPAPVTAPVTAPTSPKAGLGVQPGFLADLNRTLQRKSITRHGSLSSARVSRAEPTATMDDMALPPPPPELLSDRQKAAYGGSHISGYATLRRGPPPAPPKRDQNTKLSRDW